MIRRQNGTNRMNYLSTRGGEPATAAQAIVRGICPAGGLYVPEWFPAVNIKSLSPDMDYPALAQAILSPFLPETDADKLLKMTSRAYKSFDTPLVTPLRALTGGESVLELWHGPTMAFKDVALQMLPHLMRDSLDQIAENRTIYILVATSGDTGKAALEGFRDVEGTRVLVFYPFGGVSEAQRLQMVTQEGGNMDVCAVRGNFDDAQTGVKRIFASREAADTLGEMGYRLSSANSINFGRLLPQIVYYFDAYRHLVADGRIRSGEAVNFCVPTGNFGDILAGDYARRMGLPVHKLICASNRNNVLSEFFQKGLYNDRRPFYKSMSCSIDILISSNLERLLFEIADRDSSLVKGWMRSLQTDGQYRIGEDALHALSAYYDADWCDEADTLASIRRCFEDHGYLMDPHTAVAQTVYERYRSRTGDNTHTVLLSTANPYKFASDVLGAFETAGDDDFYNAERLHALTNAPVPLSLSGLKGKPERHTDVCDLQDMQARVIAGVRRR